MSATARPEWHDVMQWRRQQELIEQLLPGDTVFLVESDDDSEQIEGRVVSADEEGALLVQLRGESLARRLNLDYWHLTDRRPA